MSMQWVPDRVRDRAFVLEAVGRNGLALMGASAEMKADRAIVAAAVAQRGFWALRYASPDLQEDTWMIMLALRQLGRI